MRCYFRILELTGVCFFIFDRIFTEMNYLEVVKNFKDQDAAAANNKKVLVLHTHTVIIT